MNYKTQLCVRKVFGILERLSVGIYFQKKFVCKLLFENKLYTILQLKKINGI